MSSDARADRLASWVKTHYRNKQEFIDKFGLNQGEITNIIAKKRVIGERKARKLESQTDIPHMHLDGLNGSLIMLSEQKKTMDKDIEKALIIELTKAKVARWEEDQRGISTQAIWWVQAYHDAIKEIKEAEKNYIEDDQPSLLD